MFQNKNQEKQKKPRVLNIGTRRPVVIALWVLLICAFAFAVFKSFTAVDTHTVHETTVVQEEVTDTNAIRQNGLQHGGALRRQHHGCRGQG